MRQQLQVLQLLGFYRLPHGVLQGGCVLDDELQVVHMYRQYTLLFAEVIQNALQCRFGVVGCHIVCPLLVKQITEFDGCKHAYCQAGRHQTSKCARWLRLPYSKPNGC